MGKMELELCCISYGKLVKKSDHYEKRQHLNRFRKSLDDARKAGTISPRHHRQLLKKAASISL